MVRKKEEISYVCVFWGWINGRVEGDYRDRRAIEIGCRMSRLRITKGWNRCGIQPLLLVDTQSLVITIEWLVIANSLHLLLESNQ